MVFSLFLRDLLDNHYVTARTGKLDSCECAYGFKSVVHAFSLVIYGHILSYVQLLVARFSGFSCNDVIRFGIVQPSYNTVLLGSVLLPFSYNPFYKQILWLLL